MEPYLDRTLEKRLREARQGAEEIVEKEWAEAIRESDQRLEALKKTVRKVTKRYEQRVRKLDVEMARELKRFRKPLAALQNNVRKRAEQFRPELPERPAQELHGVQEQDWLFASDRDYMEQLGFYKRRNHYKRENL